MTLPQLVFVVCSVLSEPASPGGGSIGGIVLNGSHGRVPVGGAEVVLRARVDGRLMVAAETLADTEGKFRFEPLPVRSDLQYLPGANRDMVHYPGERLRLTPKRPHAHVELVVYDAAAEPSPLVAPRHEIVIRPETGALKVTETILIANPTSTCYVGRPASEGAEPVTLQLAIPSDFQRVTFHKEFFGRRFSQAEGKLVTGIPWPPGSKELKLTYVLRNPQRHHVWERKLDLPCSRLRVRVSTDKPEEVSSNLEPGATERQGEKVFQGDGRTLPAGYVVRVEMGRLPVSWMVYGRWLALAALMGLVAGASVITIGGRRRKDRQTHPGAPAPGSKRRSEPTSRRRGRANRHRRTRKASGRRLR